MHKELQRDKRHLAKGYPVFSNSRNAEGESEEVYTYPWQRVLYEVGKVVYDGFRLGKDPAPLTQATPEEKPEVAEKPEEKPEVADEPEGPQEEHQDHRKLPRGPSPQARWKK